MDYSRMTMKDLREEFKKRRFSRGIPMDRKELVDILEDYDKTQATNENAWRATVKSVQEPVQGWRAIYEDGMTVPITLDVIVDHKFKMVTYRALYETKPCVQDFATGSTAINAIHNAWTNMVASSRTLTYPIELVSPGEKSKAEILKELRALQACQSYEDGAMVGGGMKGE